MKLKNLGLFMMLILLCGNSYAAQKDIDEDTYKNMVLYATARYTAAYIENYRVKESERANITKYDENIKPEIEKSSFEKPIELNKLISLLKENNWKKTANGITAKYHKNRISVYNKNKEKKYLDLIIQKYGDFQFEEFNNEFQKEINNFLNNDSGLNPANTNSVDNAENGIGGNKKSGETGHKSNGFLYFLFVLFGGGLAYVFISNKRQINALKTEIKYFREKIDDYKSKPSTVSSASAGFSQAIKLSERDYDRIIDSVIAQINLKELKAELKQELTQTLQIKTVSQNTTSSQLHGTTVVVNNNDNTLYADSISNDFFNRVSTQSNEDTTFELNLKNANFATFTVYRLVYSRVIKRPEFLEGCEKQILPNAQTVHVESLGEAQKQPDGKWKITKKAKIIIN